MRKIFTLIFLLLASASYADQGLKISCLNMKSMFTKEYKPINFKLETTAFHYFDKKENKFKTIPSNQLMFSENSFTARFENYELGFQMIVFKGETKPTMTMSKYDYKNDKFLEHYKCDGVSSNIK